MADKAVVDAMTADQLGDLYFRMTGEPVGWADDPIVQPGSLRELIGWNHTGGGFGGWDDAAVADYHAARCKAGSASACLVHAFILESSQSAPRNAAVVADLYRKSCRGGSKAACGMAAALAGNGGRASVPVTDRYAELDKACRKGDMTSCWLQGLIIEQGPEMTEDPRWGHGTPAMVDLFTRACDGGVGCACNSLWKMALESMNIHFPSTREDEDAADRMAEKACRLRVADACEYLGVEKLMSPGVDEDGAWPQSASIKAARTLLGRACDSGDAESCRFLAITWVDLDGPARNVPTAMKFFKRACDLGDGPACRRLGGLRGDGVDGVHTGQEARADFRRGCDLGDSGACMALGDNYRALAAGGPRMVESAMNAYRRAVALEGFDLCSRIGGPWARDLEPREMDLMLNACGVACAEGFGRACGLLAKQVAPTANAIKACETSCGDDMIIRFDEMGCDRGDSDSCASLASDLEDLKGLGPKDPRVLKLLGMACRYDDQGSWCMDYADLAAQLPDGADRAAVRGHIQDACGRGDADMCEYVGNDLADGTWGAADPATAREYLNTACIAGPGPACTRLGDMWFQGIGGRRDIDAAKTYWRRAGRGGDACGFHNLGMVLMGTDAAAGTQLIETACDSVDAFYPPCFQACPTLAMIRLYHQRDVGAARGILDSVQEIAGSSGAIVQLAALRHGENPAAASELFAGASREAVVECDSGDGDACLALADWYKAVGQPENESRFRTRGLAALKAGCALGNGYACMMMRLREK